MPRGPSLPMSRFNSTRCVTLARASTSRATTTTIRAKQGKRYRISHKRRVQEHRHARRGGGKGDLPAARGNEPRDVVVEHNTVGSHRQRSWSFTGNENGAPAVNQRVHLPRQPDAPQHLRRQRRWARAVGWRRLLFALLQRAYPFEHNALAGGNPARYPAWEPFPAGQRVRRRVREHRPKGVHARSRKPFPQHGIGRQRDRRGFRDADFRRQRDDAGSGPACAGAASGHPPPTGIDEPLVERGRVPSCARILQNSSHPRPLHSERLRSAVASRPKHR